MLRCRRVTWNWLMSPFSLVGLSVSDCVEQALQLHGNSLTCFAVLLCCLSYCTACAVILPVLLSLLSCNLACSVYLQARHKSRVILDIVLTTNTIDALQIHCTAHIATLAHTTSADATSAAQHSNCVEQGQPAHCTRTGYVVIWTSGYV